MADTPMAEIPVERAQQMRDELGRLRRDARDALTVIAILVRRLGGRARITDAELAAEQGTLIQFPEMGGYSLTAGRPREGGRCLPAGPGTMKADLRAAEFEIRPAAMGDDWKAIYRRDPGEMGDWEVFAMLAPGELDLLRATLNQDPRE